MRRRITNIPDAPVTVNGKPGRLTLASIIQGRLQDRVFASDLAAVEAAAEIEAGLVTMNGSLELTQAAWIRLAAATKSPKSAGYAPGFASQLLPFLRAILEAEEVPDDG